MKNPNGYGSVFKLSGNRRKPFAVRVTTGWTDQGRQKYAYIGYYKSRQEAMIALAEYNSNPYDPTLNKITFADLYELWKKEKFPKVSEATQYGYKAAFQHCEPIQDTVFGEIRKAHLQKVIDDCPLGYESKKGIKKLINQLYKHALENDMVTKDYSRFVELPQNESKIERTPFSDKEIQLLWEQLDNMEYIDTILIMIYTGLRPGEMLEVETAKVNLEERYLRAGKKTSAGKNRLIPIHDKIFPLIEKRMDPNEKHLVKIGYSTYNTDKFKRIMENLGMNHRPHDCRHTFATLMDNAGANKTAVKRLMGHASRDITEQVYTHKDIEQLRKAINLLP